MKTETIRTSGTYNKGEQYLALCREIVGKAQELAGTSTFLGRMVDDVVNHFRACEQADCEYTAYRECLACETWFDKIEGLKTGRLKLSDVIQ